MLLSAIQSGDMTTIMVSVLLAAFLVFCIIPLHEFAHAWAAVKLGDDTPKAAGQYTLNPMAHIDPVGAVLIALFGIGWGKPTPINSYNFKNRKAGLALTALAGPMANLLCAFVFVLIYTVVQHTALNEQAMGMAIEYFCYYAAEINVFLAVFNLLPIPPLDGFDILQVLIPEKHLQWFYRYQQIISIIMIVLIFSNLFNRPLSILAGVVINFFYWLCCLPF